MKIPHLLIPLLAFLVFTAFAPRAHADDYRYFYDTLDPYGEWVEVSGYGYCWHPTGVDEQWAPYTDGYWAYTDSGWTWVSYEDYGGIVYHYGRWLKVADEGWVWVPGSEWAPAWVSWRSSDDYVGWAPLPPEAHFDVRIGFGGWCDAQFDIGPGYYSFVHTREFGEPALRSVIVNREDNVTIINRTTNITNITTVNNVTYVGGPRYEQIAAVSARPVPVLKIVRQSDPAAIQAAGGKTLAHAQGNQLVVLAPRITKPAAGEHLAPSKLAKTIASPKPEHGWSIVKDPAQRQQLQAAIKQQTHGATPATAPARKVTAAETKLPPANPGSAAVGGTAAVKEAKKGKGNQAPVVENPGQETAAGTNTAEAPMAAATPKGKHAKGKKGAPAPSVTGAEPAAAGETSYAEPSPGSKKQAKSKKSKTPAGYETEAQPGENSQPVKKTPGGESNLQPFMGGENGEPAAGAPKKKGKAPKEATHEETPSYKAPKEDSDQTPKNSFYKEPKAPKEPSSKVPKENAIHEPKGAQPQESAAGVPLKGEKGGKDQKKGKGKEEPTPQF